MAQHLVSCYLHRIPGDIQTIVLKSAESSMRKPGTFAGANRPIEEVVVLASPAEELVGEAVDEFEVLFRDGGHSAEDSFVGQSVERTACKEAW